VAFAYEHSDLAAWLLQSDGLQVTRPPPQLRIIGSSELFVITPDELVAVVQESGGALAPIALADGARQPLPARTDRPFDAL
jgi:hypothetical protein